MAQDVTNLRTPARRRAVQVPLLVTPIDASDPAWTVSRCRRILRPLTSRIATLERYYAVNRSRIAASIQNESPQVSPDSGQNLLGTGRPIDLESRSDQIHDDGDWYPHYPRKRNSRVYGKKNPAVKMQSSQATDAVTGHCAAVLGTLKVFVSEAVETKEGTWSSKQDSMPSVMKKSTVKPSESQVAEAARNFPLLPADVLFQLYKSFSAILDSTASQRGGPVSGVESLFCQCLKMVPRYRELEQEDDSTDESEKDMHALDSIYSELHNWGSTDNLSWKPLRLLVRADGVRVLCNSISCGLIPVSFAANFATLCYSQNARFEAESICDAIASYAALASNSSESYDTFVNIFSPKIECVLRLSNPSEAPGYLFKLFDRLLRDHIIPVEWMTHTCMSTVWAEAIISIAKNDSASDNAASMFTITWLLACGSLEHGQNMPRLWRAGCLNDQTRGITDESLTNLLSDVLSAMLTLCKMEPRRCCTASVRGLIDALANVIIASREVSNDCRMDPTQVSMRRAMVFLVSLLLRASSLSTTLPGPLSIETLRFGFLKESLDLDLQDFIPSLVTSAASQLSNSVVKHGRKTAEQCVREIIDRLLDMTNARTYANEHKPFPLVLRSNLRHAAVSSALIFAENTNIQQHTNWAYELEYLFETNNMDTVLNCCCKRPTCRICGPAEPQFRWDNAIDEWVQKTPMAKKLQTQVLQVSNQPNSRSQEIWEDAASSSPAAVAGPTPEPANSLQQRGTRGENAIGTTLLSLSDTPAPSQRPKRSRVDDHAAVNSKRRRMFPRSMDGAADADEDELSALTDRNVNRNPFQVRGAKPVQKAEKTQSRSKDGVELVSPPWLQSITSDSKGQRRGSSGSLVASKTKHTRDSYPALRRKKSAPVVMSIKYSSEDELAL